MTFGNLDASVSLPVHLRQVSAISVGITGFPYGYETDMAGFAAHGVARDV
jgi:hypothetical protein